MPRDNIEITVLDNDLRIISQQMKETEAITIELWMGVGSRHETKEQCGISHFLEHMAFKGTKLRSAKQIAEEFDNIGGQLNAYTAKENTVFYAKVLKDNFFEALEILSDIILNSAFELKEIELERDVVLQEIAMTNDSPDDIIFDLLQETAFNDQALGRSILGPVDIVKKLNQTDLKGYVSNHYTSTNCILSVAGNISHDKIVEFAQKSLSPMKKGSRSKKEEALYTGGMHRENRKLEQVHITFGFEGSSYKNTNAYAMQLLSAIIGGGMSSRLFQEIRENLGLAYSVNSFTSSFADTGMFYIYSATNPNKIAKLIDATFTQLHKATSDIKESELQKVKFQAKASLLMSLDSINSRASSMGRRLMCFDKYITNKEILENIEAVSLVEVKQLLEKTLSTKLTVAAIGKLNKLADYDVLSKRMTA
jgi:predicted Zn-dependent peptidase